MSLGLLSPVIDSRRAVSAETRTALSWFIACDRDLTAELLAILNIWIVSTGPSVVFAVAVARPESTA